MLNRCVLVLSFCVLFGANASRMLANPDKVMKLKKISQPIHIDGAIDPVWMNADSVADFVQFMPYHDKPPSRKTAAKIITTEDALYCLMLCWDDKENIQGHTGKLDDFGGDVVSLMIDTFGDRRTAYKFAVSASGVRADCRLLDDARNRDYSWDGVWYAATKIYDWGFAIEMEIPYRSIQYDETLTEWGLDFDRWIPTLNEDIYWCSYIKNEGQRISKFGSLVFEDFQPSVRGLNLEIYPVGIAKAEYLGGSDYKGSPHAGADIFYNPSQRLTFQLTANPDFAQIEADPYDFNISRYESYFNERRPFFTEGKEVFMPSGKERNSGFYQPLELFYSRRIGRKLPDGGEVPLLVGTKAFGRVGGLEYGGFVALTGEQDYVEDSTGYVEQRAVFNSVRLKKQIMGNSSIGLLYVGKSTNTENTGVIDIDGAFRASDWQLSYQLARSYKNSSGDFAASFGMLMPKEKMVFGMRGRYIGNKFDIDEVGFVPWQGTSELTMLLGPKWYFDKGYVKEVLIYFGAITNYERVDSYTDRAAVLGWNVQFRNNWGFEISVSTGSSKEEDVKFTSYDVNYSSWFNISPKWNANFNGGYSKTYNFDREYLAYYTWFVSEFSWQALNVLNLGTACNVFIEFDPDQRVEDITYNTRPFFSWTPVNDLNIRMYFDNVWLRSTKKIDQLIAGFLFSYNFRPKSWIYFAVNEVQDRSAEYDVAGNLLPNRLHTTDRVSVFKLKYLFYF